MIDINCDLGESFGAYRLGSDADMMKWITSANVACGYHAGDPLVMETTVRLAAEAGVKIGAHPGYPDLQGFGRRVMECSPQEVEAFMLYQLGALSAFTRAAGVDLVHVKPHGALYNQAAKDAALAQAIARAVVKFSRSLVLVGLAGSRLVEAGSEAGLAVMAEGFPERGYNPDGTLMNRKLPGALLTDPAQAAENAHRLAKEGIAITSGSQTRYVQVDTLCIHGDNPHAVEVAKAIRQRLGQD